MHIPLKGLTHQEAARRLANYGPNRVTAKRRGFLAKLGVKLRSPITIMLVVAAILSWIDGKYFDAGVVLFLLILNVGIEFWQEHRADASLAMLQQKLVVQSTVLRDDQWQQLPAEQIVPGDVVRVGVGDVVPADLRVEQATNAGIDQAALTGESLPVTKNVGDTAFSGSFVTTGQLAGTVTATSMHTRYGKILLAVQGAHKRSLLEQDVLRIARFLSYISVGAMVILDVVLVFWAKAPFTELLRLDLSLVIAGIPVSLPTVMALIINVGVIALSQKGAVVRRLSALQNFANVTLLLSDKTGTLTANKLSVANIIAYGDASKDDVLHLAATAAQQQVRSVIDDTIKAAANAKHLKLIEVDHAVPADSVRKHNTAIVGNTAIASGAPFAVLKYIDAPTAVKEQCKHDVAEAAKNGYRTLAIAHNRHGTAEKDMMLIGLLLLADEPRPSAKTAISFMRREGITVKMVTGDAQPIAQRVATDVGIAGAVAGRAEFYNTTEWLHQHGGLAEALPEDKLALVKTSLPTNVVAVTGDGINDLPAMSAADVGIAVQGAVDAARSDADISLTRAGLSAIKDAILQARTIFARLYNYSVYRISESFRLVVSIALLGMMYGEFPLTALQIILIAFLNDIPIISLAYDRVNAPHRPAKINVRERFIKSTIFGLTGVANSVILFIIMNNVWHLSLAAIQTAYFLKLTVSGHMLIYVAHTEQKWWRFWPSKQVIIATSATQLLATALALFGWLVAAIPLWLVIVVWAWSFLWMQIAEVTKRLTLGRKLV
ncbi:MAG TPA: HAD-IC family P-type ATPase [Candidatus Saccharimonas sp.]|nr:HAD-IC family P-type ATPase [Candidatus Saccharimonas sp.]